MDFSGWCGESRVFGLIELDRANETALNHPIQKIGFFTFCV